jgi:uncharacterized protein (DUF1015 family)
MAEIFPFRGLRYDTDKLAAEGATLNDVVTPPYDVIDKIGQAAFYDRHPANFIRVDLNRKTDRDTAQDNPYTRAAGFIDQWEREGVLRPEEKPAIYAYSQSWVEPGGERVTRQGAIALLKLAEFESGPGKPGTVLPHEHTLKGPKQDRMDLMRHTQCNLSQVFLIYADPQRTLETLLYGPSESETAWSEATDADGVVHRFRAVTDASVLSRLQALFKTKTLLIADGHHRYETALAYRREIRDAIREKTGQEPPEGSLLSDYAAVFLTNMDDPGLKVYPTHRILRRWPAGWDRAQFEAELFKRYEPADAESATFLYRPAGSDERQPLRLKPEAAPGNLPPLLDTFDAALLEETVFKGVFNSTGETLKQDHVLSFHRNEPEIEALWRVGEAVAGFYLTAPSVRLVHRICESGHRMPQKSTYFYPKILSGLVIYPYRAFRDGRHALDGVVNDARPLETSNPVSAPAVR